MVLKIRTAADLAADAEAAEQARAAANARRYLAKTDWMVIRAAETGLPLPDDIAEARAVARRIATARVPDGQDGELLGSDG
ncbi:MAG: hypothetical protein ACXIVG_08335 [Pararhodobacter sp.]